jgi:hypothetical protein
MLVVLGSYRNCHTLDSELSADGLGKGERVGGGGAVNLLMCDTGVTLHSVVHATVITVF